MEPLSKIVFPLIICAKSSNIDVDTLSDIDHIQFLINYNEFIKQKFKIEITNLISAQNIAKDFEASFYYDHLQKCTLNNNIRQNKSFLFY